MNDRVLAGRKIGLFGRGGAGKSTTTTLLAHALVARGYRVCVLDADSTNIGLHLALGLTSLPSPLVDYFGGMAFSGGTIACPVEDPSPLPNAAVSLSDLPAQYVQQNEQGTVLMSAGKLVDRGFGPGCDGPMTKVARDLSVTAADQPLVTLVDCKAGFEDSARGVIAGIDWALVVVDPTVSGIEMSSSMQRMFEQMKAGLQTSGESLAMPKRLAWANIVFQTAKLRGVLAVLNKVQDEQMQRQLSDSVSGCGVKIIGTLPYLPPIATSWLMGQALDPVATQTRMQDIVREIERAEQSTDQQGRRP